MLCQEFYEIGKLKHQKPENGQTNSGMIIKGSFELAMHQSGHCSGASTGKTVDRKIFPKNTLVKDGR